MKLPAQSMSFWSPGGNPTYLISQSGIPMAQYAEINAYLLRRYPRLEQGGFIVPPESERAVARLQMAGGEFCLNATRAFAAALCDDSEIGLGSIESANYARLFRQPDASARFLVEVSGAPDPLTVAVTTARGGWDVAVELPVLQYDICETVAHISVSAVRVQVVALPGITHLILPCGAALPEDALVRREVAESLLSELGLTTEPAVGFLSWAREGDTLALQPLVWVRALATCIMETSCGSGSLALALSLRQSGKVQIRQPSGSLLNINLAGTGEARTAEVRGIVERLSAASLCGAPESSGTATNQRQPEKQRGVNE